MGVVQLFKSKTAEKPAQSIYAGLYYTIDYPEHVQYIQQYRRRLILRMLIWEGFTPGTEETELLAKKLYWNFRSVLKHIQTHCPRLLIDN